MGRDHLVTTSRPDNCMIVIPIPLLEVLYGKLNEHGKYYFRRSRKGIIYACRCPNRKGHVKTPAELANQQRFASTWGQRYKKS